MAEYLRSKSFVGNLERTTRRYFSSFLLYLIINSQKQRIAIVLNKRQGPGTRPATPLLTGSTPHDGRTAEGAATRASDRSQEKTNLDGSRKSFYFKRTGVNDSGDGAVWDEGAFYRRKRS
ncbi:hypothetical protein EVAR_24462_1 [Eumeta japonica]|uniref:Uncharacterized protein n=1 Tax=Eumeta variegata TaxID=151549 RepID=A0A4C1WUQ7_EUMVA|nr:hypothetical protein EVAR_24462_1 [Eumeta japonica]